MHKYSGVILDFYDDKGATLKTKFPTVDALPDTIKTASVLPREELPNEAFALVAVNGAEVLRKFACHDAGTTAMSVIYLMEHGHKLPEEAVKVAAANLVDACLEYGMLPPVALTKVAKWYHYEGVASPKTKKVVGKVIDRAKNWAGGKVEGVGEHIGKGMARGAEKQLAAKAEKLKKEIADVAEQVGSRAVKGATKTVERHVSKPATQQKIEGVARTVGRGAQKGMLDIEPSSKNLRNVAILATVGGTGVAAGGAAGRYLSKKTHEVKQKMEDAVAGEEKGAEAIDITGLSPRAKVKRASTHHMFQDKFPIDSWDQIKKAEAYLLENDCRLDPVVRRECAVKLASRAVDVGYPIHDDILEHGAYSFAPDGELVAAIEMRKVAGADVKILYGLMEKRASLDPNVYAECVRRFDIINDLDGVWDSRLPDPWRSTFGLAKTAAVVWENGADRVDEGQLENLATNGKQALLSNFSQAFVHEFCQDPVSMFNSMPTPEKRLLSRLASDISSDGRSEGMPKTAKLRVGDIEDRLGVYLPDEREEKARKMIEYRKQRSFTLRHPWVTGVPTLGIAPAIAKHRATSSIANQMMREDPGLRRDVSKVRLEKRQQELEDYRLATERARAEQAERAAGQLGTALMGAMALRNEDHRDERFHQRTSW